MQCHPLMEVTGDRQRQESSNLILMLHGLWTTELVLRVLFSIIRGGSHSYSLEHTKTLAIHDRLCLVERSGYTGFTLESDYKGIVD